MFDKFNEVKQLKQAQHIDIIKNLIFLGLNPNRTPNNPISELHASLFIDCSLDTERFIIF